MRRSSLLGRAVRLTLLGALALAPWASAHGTTITVDSDLDVSTGGCTLREAVETANTNAPVGGCAVGTPGSDTIVFDVGVALINLASQITITEDLIITGNGDGVTTVSGAPATRVFEVAGASTVSFEEVEITSAGSTSITGFPTDGGAIYISGAGDVSTEGVTLSNHQVSGSGGAVWISATGSYTALSPTAFDANRARGTAATQGGGAIYTDGGDVSVHSASFTDNRALGASGSGGAILNPNGATLNVSNSMFTANRSQRAGGAIETVDGVTTVADSYFVRNTAGASPGNGGAIHGGGTVDIGVSSGSASSNRATEGGAFWIGSSGTLTVTGSSFFDNVATGDAADQGGGAIYSDGGTLIVQPFVLRPPSPSVGAPTSHAVAGGASNFFFGNRATGASGSGGAVLTNGGSATFIETIFDTNRAQRAGGAIEVTAPLASTPVTVTLNGATLNGNVAGDAPGNGGGLHTTTGEVTLVVADGAFAGNDAASEGGGLWINTGTTLTLSGSVLDGNTARGAAADNGGGGLFVNGGDATVMTTTFEANETLGGGAGGGLLAVAGTTTVEQSLFTENYASRGGGLAAIGSATVSVENTTFYDNTARFGGAGFSSSAVLSFDSATLASNTAAIGGGGLYNQNPPNQGVPFVTLTNTIVADNSATNGPNLKGRHASGGWNVIGTTPPTPTFPALASDQTGTDPMLGPLQDNGGPTRTAALMAGSPAIDTGMTDLTVDQRGVARTEPDDVGAVEFGDADGGGADVLISEFEPNPPGADPGTQQVELSGTPGEAFSGSLLSIENDGVDGTLDRRADVSGTFDSNGLLVVTLPDLENPSFTLVLATGTPATTTVGTDLDADDNGAIDDESALGTVLDAVGVSDAAGDDGTLYASGLGGTDVLFNGDTEPYIAFRDASTGRFYQVVDDADPSVYDASGALVGFGEFDGDPSATTFGAINPSRLPGLMATSAATAQAATLDALTVTPNPFRTSARATFAVREAQAVTVTLYDVMGRQVQQVFAGTAQAETPVTVTVDGSSLAAGVYVLVLQGETVRATRQVTVAR